MSGKVLSFFKRIARPASIHGALLALLMLALSVNAAAQTAHYSFVQQSVGSLPHPPSGLAVDANGNVYASSSGDPYIYEFTPSNGTYTQSFRYDYAFKSPSPVQAVAADSINVWGVQNGSIYQGTVGSQGLAFDPSALGTLSSNVAGMSIFTGSTMFGPVIYTADTGGNRIADGDGIGAPRTVVAVTSPMGVAAVADGSVWGALFVTTGNTLLKYTGGMGAFTPTTIASDLNAPQGVAADAFGNIYVADTGNNRIQKFTPANGTYTESTLISGLTAPTRIVTGAGGDFYIAQQNSNSVLRFTTGAVDFGTTNVETKSSALSLTFTFDRAGTISAPAVLTQGAPGLDFVDAGTGTCTTNGTSHTYAAGDTCTVNVTFTPKFPGMRNGAVLLEDSRGIAIATAYVHGNGSGPQVSFLPAARSTFYSSTPSSPTGVALDGAGNPFMIFDDADSSVLELAEGNRIGLGSFNHPLAVALDGAGNVFVADSAPGGNNTSVYQIPRSGEYGGYSAARTLATGFWNVKGLAIDGAGNVFVSDTNNQMVKEIVAAGGYTTVNTLASGFTPWGIAVDGSGNVFVGDASNGEIKKILASGGYTTTNTIAIDFSTPAGLALDGNGNVFVADFKNNDVKEILASSGYITENTLATGLNQPEGLAVDGSGNVFVAEFGGQQVLKLNLSDAPTLTFGDTVVGVTSAEQTVALQNIGNAALTLAVPTSGNNPSVAQYFTLDTSSETACPVVTDSSAAATLAAGTSCTLSVAFAPTVAGSVSGSVVLTDNALNATSPTFAAQQILLTGVGTDAPPPPPTLPPTTLTLGASPALSNFGQMVTLTATLGSSNLITNGGFETGDFTGWNSDEGMPGSAPHAGSWAAGFGDVGAYGTISQTLTTQAGASYTLSFWLSNGADGDGVCDFQVMWNGTLVAGGDISGCNNFGYTQYTLTVTGTGSDTLSFAGRNDPDYYGLDDVIASSNLAMAPTNSEQVTFSNGSTTLGTGTLQNGVAALQINTLPAGTNSVTATYAGDSSFAGSSASATVTVAGPPAQIMIASSGSPQTTGVNTDFANPLAVTVVDTNGAPVPGQTVTYTVSPSSDGASATLSSPSAITGVSDGTAWVTAIANGTAGSYTVTASVGSVTGTFNLINAVPPVFTVTTLDDDMTGNFNNCTDQTLSGATLDASCSLRDAIAAAQGAPAPFNRLVQPNLSIATKKIARKTKASRSLAADATGGSSLPPTVNFASSLTYGADNQTLTPSASTPGTINIDTGGTLVISSDVNIVGPGANAMSVASASLNRIFYVNGETTTSIKGLTITGGSYREGSGIKNFGRLALNDCTISNNIATQYSGAGIHNAGTLTLRNSTVSGNTAANNGGGIVNYGALAVFNSTIIGNTATNSGGGLYNSGGGESQASAVLTNSTISGNQDNGTGSAGVFNNATLTMANNLIADSVNGNSTDNGGNVIGGVNNVTAASTSLAPLGYYGGTTQTMPPLPGSTGICAGLAANVPNIATATDQRGINFPRANITYPGYSSSNACVDAGAVQTSYALTFTTQPPSSMQPGVAFTSSNAPQITLTESGSPAALVNSSLSVSGNPSTVSGNSVTLNAGAGSFSGLSVSTAADSEQLTATLSLNVNLPLSITATSNSYTVVAPQLPATVTALDVTRDYGAANPTFTGTLTAFLAGDGITATYATTATALSPVGTYPITVTLLDPNNKLGGYAVTNTPGTLTVSKTALTVTASSATLSYSSSIPTLTGTILGVVNNDGITATYTTSATSASNIGTYQITALLNDPNGTLSNYSVTNTPGTLTIGAAALTVTPNSLLTTYNGPIPALTGVLSGVVSKDGITATYSTTATQGSNAGTYPITATLHDTNSKLGNYSVTNTPGTLTINKAPGSLTSLSTSVVTDYFGQALTFTSKTINAAGTPDGSVSFYDGTKLLGNVTLASGSAVYSSSTLSIGTHSITAVYAGSTNYVGATSSLLSQVILAPAVSINGSATGGSLGSITVNEGGSATTTFKVGGLGTLTSAVSLSCSGLAQGLSCQMSASSVNVSGLPATVTVTVSSTKYQIIGSNFNKRSLAPLAWAFALILPGIVVVRRNRKFCITLLAMLGLVLILGMSACGSGKGITNASSLTPVGSYTATITATSTGATPITTNLTVAVQP